LLFEICGRYDFIGWPRLELDSKDVAYEMATVEITTPASKLIAASSDLKALR
jgi:hypothetical protein